MARKVKRKERRYFEKYVREIARHMWLGSWLLTMRWGDEGDFDEGDSVVMASCNYLPRYRRATLTFNPELLDNAAFYIREVVVHELLHCHHGPLDQWIGDDLIAGYSPEAIDIHGETHNRMTEEFLTIASRLMAESLPEYVPYAKAKS